MSDHPEALTPTEIVARLDQYVVGQHKAKRAVAVALRNRWRRRQLPRDLAADVYPKNILLIGATGVGKTEIARRLASLARAPFVKVEASKYSEVGYHGRDVESMVRDLAESAVALVRQEHSDRVRVKAADAVEERIFESIAAQEGLDLPSDPLRGLVTGQGIWRPGPVGDTGDEEAHAGTAERQRARDELRAALRARQIEDRVFEIEVLDSSTPTLSITGPQGSEAMGIDARALQEMWGRSPARRTKIRRTTVAEAREILLDEEADKLLDQDAIVREALDRAQNDGIIFVDEIDKVVGAGGSDGPDVSREGVQRDLLPIVEGSAVYTRYGHLRTDHVLFIAAGAFHFHKPSELIPELQGRFPVRVALQALTEADFVRILTEPRNSLVKQYQALFAAENVTLTFAPEGVARLAKLAFDANKTTQNIGARRLMTILERCLEDLSFSASEWSGREVVVDEKLVRERLGETGDDEDLIRYDL
ncbi:MAG: ATP-dependent protease ATPase subunit HslU [Planctomycetota bacterium]